MPAAAVAIGSAADQLADCQGWQPSYPKLTVGSHRSELALLQRVSLYRITEPMHVPGEHQMYANDSACIGPIIQ